MTEDWKEIVVEALAKRKSLGFTQKKHAALAGVSIPTMIDFEKGKASLTLQKVQDILTAIGMNTKPKVVPDYIAEEEESYWKLIGEYCNGKINFHLMVGNIILYDLEKFLPIGEMRLAFTRPCFSISQKRLEILQYLQTFTFMRYRDLLKEIGSKKNTLENGLADLKKYEGCIHSLTRLLLRDKKNMILDIESLMETTREKGMELIIKEEGKPNE